MKTVRIVVSDHAFFQFDCPEGFDYGMFLKMVRLEGHYYDGVSVFVPYHHIQSIIMLDKDVMLAATQAQNETRQ